MRNADLFELLAQARDSVFRDSLCREYDDTHKAAAMEEHKKRTRLLSRIDAALAEREAEVEWESGTDYEGKTFASAQVRDVAVEVNGWDRAGTRFYWRIFSTLDEEGHADTLDDAKAAAIRAARGMR